MNTTSKVLLYLTLASSLFFFGCGKAQLKQELLEANTNIKEAETKLQEMEQKLALSEDKLKESEAKLQEMEQKLTLSEDKLKESEAKLQEMKQKLTLSQNNLKKAETRLLKIEPQKAAEKQKRNETPSQAYERLMSQTVDLVYKKYGGQMDKASIGIMLTQQLGAPVLQLIETNETLQKQSAPGAKSDEEMIYALENIFRRAQANMR